MGRHVALHEQGARLRVEAGGQQQGRHGHGGLAHVGGIPGLGESVEIDDAIEGVALTLVLHPPADGTEVVAQVRNAGGLDAREDSGHPAMVCPGADGPAAIVGVCPTR